MKFRYLFFIWFVLPAYLLASTVGFKGLVLCFEIDGDVMLETAPSGLNCEPESDPTMSAKGDNPQMDRVSSHCGTCVDQPLTVGRSAERPTKLAENALVGAMAFQVPSSFLLSSPSERAVYTISQPSAALTALCTVILLV